MTNYANYPSHTFHNNSCVICFNHGGYAWCILSNSQKKYLVESAYLDDSYRVDIKLDGKVYELSVNEFKKWVTMDEIDVSKERKVSYEVDEICPECGKKLVKRVARKGKNAGEEFIGCSGFPSCNYIKR
jgi:hypothetical protein